MASASAMLERFWVPPWQIRLVFRATCTIRRPSLILWLTGFSTYTSLPACMAQMAASACQWLGVQTNTASTDLSSNTRRMSCTCFGARPPCCFSTMVDSSAESCVSGSQTYTISQPGLLASSPACALPRMRQPIMATRTVLDGFPAGLSSE